jgi:hypothetical protein
MDAVLLDAIERFQESPRGMLTIRESGDLPLLKGLGIHMSQFHLKDVMRYNVLSLLFDKAISTTYDLTVAEVRAYLHLTQGEVTDKYLISLIQSAIDKLKQEVL